MAARVVQETGGHRLVGDSVELVWVNAFLAHLGVRGFSPATVRAYAFDLANFVGFLGDRGLLPGEVRPVHLFDYLGWQQRRARSGHGKVVALRAAVAPATLNRRVSTVRGWFEFLVVSEHVATNPVPSPRRSTGSRSSPASMLGHVARKASDGRGGRLVSQPSRLPESLDPDDVAVFLADLNTHRDRAIVLAMVLGGLRSAEVRSLRLADVDMGMRRVRGGGQRQPGTDRADRPRVLRRVRRVSARRAAERDNNDGVFRGVARPDVRSGVDRGRSAQGVPDSSREFGGGEGSTSSSVSSCLCKAGWSWVGG